MSTFLLTPFLLHIFQRRLVSFLINLVAVMIFAPNSRPNLYGSFSIYGIRYSAGVAFGYIFTVYYHHLPVPQTPLTFSSISSRPEI